MTTETSEATHTTEVPVAAPAPDAAPAAAPAASPVPAPPEQTTVTGAPEKYEPFKVGDAALGADDQAAVEALSRDLDLTQEAAQKLAASRAADRTAATEAQQKAVADARTGWVNEVKADKELGGDKLAENLGVAKAGLKHYDPDGKLAELLDSTGFGDHPEVIRYFHRVGKAVGPDGSLPGRGGTPNSPNTASAAQRLYANSNMNP